jgi:hypothetical protein
MFAVCEPKEAPQMLQEYGFSPSNINNLNNLKNFVKEINYPEKNQKILPKKEITQRKTQRIKGTVSRDGG